MFVPMDVTFGQSAPGNALSSLSLSAGATGEAITFFNVDYDKECAPALAKIARTAGQEVPPWLARYEKNKADEKAYECMMEKDRSALSRT